MPLHIYSDPTFVKLYYNTSTWSIWSKAQNYNSLLPFPLFDNNTKYGIKVMIYMF